MVAFPLVHISWSLPQDKRKLCDAFLTDVFGAEKIYELLITPENAALGYDREESLLLISNSLLIPMAPGGGGLADGSPIGDMLRRSAKPEMWLGIAVRVANLDAADAWLRSRGIIPHYDPGAQGHYCMIRRKETLGVRIEFMTEQLPGDPRAQTSSSSDFWRDHHPLGIERLQSIGVSVERLEDAQEIFAEKWGWPEIYRRHLPGDQADAIGFQMGDCVVEAMRSAISDSRLARHAGEIRGIYCLTYKVKSLTAVKKYLSDKGLRLIGDDVRLAIDPRSAFDRLIYFTKECPEGVPSSEAALAVDPPFRI